MRMAALQTEADDYVGRHRGERDEMGCALVVRNGRAQARELTLGAGTVELRAPRVNDRRRDDEGRSQRCRLTLNVLLSFAQFEREVIDGS